MLIQVYKITGKVSHTVAKATLVAEFEVDEYPRNEQAILREHGGDFIEIVNFPRS